MCEYFKKFSKKDYKDATPILVLADELNIGSVRQVCVLIAGQYVHVYIYILHWLFLTYFTSHTVTVRSSKAIITSACVIAEFIRTSTVYTWIRRALIHFRGAKHSTKAFIADTIERYQLVDAFSTDARIRFTLIDFCRTLRIDVTIIT